MFARKQAIFRIKEDITLDYNYQHEVLKNLYHYIGTCSENMEKLLHEEGYRVEEGHRFKLFNHTLLFSKASFGDNICLPEGAIIKLLFSGVGKIIDPILEGLLNVKGLRLEDKIFSLESIEEDRNFKFHKVMLYKAISPIVETTKDEQGIMSLNPYDQRYYMNLTGNLKKKYKLVYGEEYEDSIYFDIDDMTRIREKSFRFKEGRVKGHTFEVWIESTEKMQRIAYYLGLGQNSSSGAGCITYVTGRGVYHG